MYHQYMFGNFSPVIQPSVSSGNPQNRKKGTTSKSPQEAPIAGLSDLLGGFGIKNALSKFDTGDILLILIVLFLFLEGDNLELVITLGLMLFFGLEEPQSTV